MPLTQEQIDQIFDIYVARLLAGAPEEVAYDGKRVRYGSLSDISKVLATLTPSGGDAETVGGAGTTRASFTRD